MQARVAVWHRDRYPTADVRDVALKVAEEAGEVCRAVVEDWHPSLHRPPAALATELGDVVIACYALASKAGIDLEAAVSARWATVSERTRA